MKFFDVLELEQKDIVSLIGAGGKTSTMFTIGKEAEQKGFKTILTTTTKIFYPRDSALKVIVSDRPNELYDQINNALTDNNVIIVGKSIRIGRDLDSTSKLLGLDADLFKILATTKADLIIVEADGAARKPFKAPASHEPVIPQSSTIVMPIVGIDCVNKCLSSANVHRPEIIAKIAGVKVQDKITPEVIATVLTSVLGYRKGLPSQASWLPFINKVESSSDLNLARQVAFEIAYKMAQKTSSKVLIGAALQKEPVKEVIEF